MEIINQLVAFAQKLEAQDKISLASDVDGAAVSLVKVARNMGPQGYWVRNTRCWQGCYRKKRQASPEKSAGEVWMECLEEFQSILKDDSETWDKYAESESLIKTAEDKANTVKFAQIVSEQVEAGESIGFAVFDSLESQRVNAQLQVIQSAEALMKVSAALEDDELAKEAAQLASAIIKEAQAWDWAKKQMGNAANWAKNKVVEKTKQYTGNADTAQTTKRLQNILRQVDAVRTRLPKDFRQAVPQNQQAAVDQSFQNLQKTIAKEMQSIASMTRKDPESGKLYQAIMKPFSDFSSAQDVPSRRMALERLSGAINQALGQTANPANATTNVPQPKAPTGAAPGAAPASGAAGSVTPVGAAPGVAATTPSSTGNAFSNGPAITDPDNPTASPAVAPGQSNLNKFKEGIDEPATAVAPVEPYPLAGPEQPQAAAPVAQQEAPNAQAPQQQGAVAPTQEQTQQMMKDISTWAQKSPAIMQQLQSIYQNFKPKTPAEAPGEMAYLAKNLFSLTKHSRSLFSLKSAQVTQEPQAAKKPRGRKKIFPASPAPLPTVPAKEGDLTPDIFEKWYNALSPQDQAEFYKQFVALKNENLSKEQAIEQAADKVVEAPLSETDIQSLQKQNLKIDELMKAGDPAPITEDAISPSQRLVDEISSDGTSEQTASDLQGAFSDSIETPSKTTKVPAAPKAPVKVLEDNIPIEDVI